MNPLRRPAVAARREGTPSGEIDGSTPVEADPGIGDGGGSPYGPDGRLRPGGASAGGQGAPAHGVQAPRGRGVDASWMSSPAAVLTAIPTSGAGVPASGVGAGGLGMAAMAADGDGDGKARPRRPGGSRRPPARAPPATSREKVAGRRPRARAARRGGWGQAAAGAWKEEEESD